jgi:hypothetical protein
VAGHKINLQKSIAFIYTSNKQTEKEYMETIPFTIISIKVKYLGVNLTKDVNDLYKENYKLLKKEIQEDYRMWKDLSCSWIGRINRVKMAIVPKAIYMFNVIPINPNDIHHRDRKIYPKVHLVTQEIANSQGNTQEKKQCWRYHNIGLQTILQSNSEKTTWYWHKNRHEYQWNRIEDPDMNPHSYAHLIFDKVAKNIRWRKGSLFNKCCWEKWLSSCKILKLYPFLLPYTNINSKWIKVLNISLETLMLVLERQGIL